MKVKYSTLSTNYIDSGTTVCYEYKEVVCPVCEGEAFVQAPGFINKIRGLFGLAVYISCDWCQTRGMVVTYELTDCGSIRSTD